MRKKIVFVILILLLLVGALAACADRGPFTVAFAGATASGISINPNLESIPASVILTEPIPRVPDGYVFSGWFRDANFATARVEFPFRVTANRVLYARYDVAFALTFVARGNPVYAAFYAPGTPIVPPPQPDIAGFTAEGWGFVPSVMPNHNLTVAGNYDPIRFRIVFRAQDGVTFENTAMVGGQPATHQTVLNGAPMSLRYVYAEFLADGARNYQNDLNRVVAKREGYSFSHWSIYTQADGRQRFEFPAVWDIPNNILLRPEWVPEGSAGVEYERRADNASYRVSGYRIDAYNRFNEHVRVPSMHNGLPVVEIGDNAFWYRGNEISNIVTMELPSTITRIGNNAFRNNTRLRALNIPNSVTEIGRSAFEFCISLVTINSPANQVTLPASILLIGENAFRNALSITRVNLAANGLREIGSGAFEGATSLTRINLPSTLTWLGAFAFADASSLQRVDNFHTTQITRVQTSTFENCTSLEVIDLPPTATRIEARAFKNATRLNAVNRTSSLLVIETEAFMGASNLMHLVIPITVSVIQANAFLNCGMDIIIISTGNAQNPQIPTGWQQGWNIRSLEGGRVYYNWLFS
jgi:uncharacterized repeat protein (TIGR02543 family)